jgi:hypothetical protein
MFHMFWKRFNQWISIAAFTLVLLYNWTAEPLMEAKIELPWADVDPWSQPRNKGTVPCFSVLSVEVCIILM